MDSKNKPTRPERERRIKMAIEMKKENVKTVADVMEEIKSHPNMECGVEEIIFPDGSKEKFYYNGKEDRDAAIVFAQICINATDDSNKAKRMMFICFNLMVKGICPTEVVKLSAGEAYVDHKKGIIVDQMGNTIAEVKDEEKVLCGSNVPSVRNIITSLLVERAENKLRELADEEEDW